jgi:hypothetical protein
VKDGHGKFVVEEEEEEEEEEVDLRKLGVSLQDLVTVRLL